MANKVTWQRLLEWFSPIHRHAKALAEERAERDLKILRAGGWHCHGCGDARPAAMIAQMTDRWQDPVSGETTDRTLRYCVDRPGCVKVVATHLAPIRHRLEDKEDET